MKIELDNFTPEEILYISGCISYAGLLHVESPTLEDTRKIIEEGLRIIVTRDKVSLVRMLNVAKGLRLIAEEELNKK